MKRISVILFLATISVLYASAQSGRRVVTTRTTPTAPIQPPLTPEPELPASKTSSTVGELLFLPESLREREIKPIGGESFRLSDFSGKVVVINLWASWCGPCRREVPEYEKVRKNFDGRSVEFVALTTDDPRFTDRVNRFLREVTFGFRLGWADSEMARTLMNGKGAIPQTLVLDSEGHVINHWVGYAPSRNGERLKETIESALKDLSQH
jgi:thiol-disulfide isomerase/thioredoxin